MKRLERQSLGWDLRFAEFLALAPVSCVAAFAVLLGGEAAARIGLSQAPGAAIFGFAGGLFVMAAHYVVATLPSAAAWGLATWLARSCGLGPDAAMRVAAPLTAAVASALLLLWFRDDDLRGLVPTIAVISTVASALVAERIIRSSRVRGAG